MPTFNNGEGGLSVRTKLNDAITKVDYLRITSSILGHGTALSSPPTAQTGDLALSDGTASTDNFGVDGEGLYILSEDGNWRLIGNPDEVLNDKTQTLTNKTLTSPVLNGTAAGTALQSSATDTTPEKLHSTTHPPFGLGAEHPPLISDFTADLRPGLYRYTENGTTDAPGPGAAWPGTALVLRGGVPDGGGDQRINVLAGRAAGAGSGARLHLWWGGRSTDTGALDWRALRTDPREAASAGELGPIVYTSRAAFVTDVAAGVFDEVADGFVVELGNAPVRWYKSAGATAISDLGDWLPLGHVYPDHWAENTTPGTTDMAAAFNAALAWSREVHMRPATYLVLTSVTVPDARPSSLLGAGPGVTNLVSTAATINIIDVKGTTARPQNVTIAGMTIQHLGGAKTGGAHIKVENYPVFCTFKDIHLRNIYTGIRCEGAQKCIFHNIMFNNQDASAAGEALIDLTVTAADQEVASVMLSNVDGFAGVGATDSGCSKGLKINKVDGLYGVNCHFFRFDYGLHVEPDEATNAHEDTVASIMFANSYFDYSIESNVYFGGNTTTNRGHIFNGCTFMNAQGLTGGFVIDTDDFQSCIISDSRIGLAQSSGISTSNKNPAGLQISNVHFLNNNRRNVATHGDISWRGENLIVNGAKFEDGGAAGWNIGLTTGATGDADLSGLDTSASSVPASNRITNTASIPVWEDGVQYITNANGEAWKYKSGLLVCIHSLASSSSAAVTWTYPEPFLTGTIPAPTIIAASASGDATTGNLVGAPGATSLAFNMFNAATSARVALTCRLTVTGKWKQP